MTGSGLDGCRDKKRNEKDMIATDLHGIFPALPTPLTPEGRPDLGLLTELVEHNLAAGVAGLVPMGGTGEYTALSPADRNAVVRRTAEVAAGAVPIVPGVLATGLADAVAAGGDFRAAGADAIMLVTPYYVIPSQQGVQDYFRAYRKAVDASIVYYDIPARTGFVTQPETMAALAEDGTIIGAKICNTDLHYFNRLSCLLGDRISLLSGDDMLYAMHVMHGARGGILASAPLLPRFWTALHKLLVEGEYATAISRHRKLLPIFRALFAEVNPGPLKAIMAELGRPTGAPHLPLMEPTAATQGLIEEAVRIIRRDQMA